jgi:hypothetical protein
MNKRGRYRSVGIALAILSFFLLASLAPPLMAQSQTISGTVLDATGAVVPQATVKITDVAKGSVARETTTDGAGRFQAIGIQPGRYTVEIEKSGFKKSEVAVTLDVNAKVDVGQITLELGQLAEAVSVNADAAIAIQTNTMEKAYLVDQVQIAQLPMNGRNWVALMNTVPGMSSSARNDFDTNFNDVSGFHGLGGRGSQNNFYLDGSPNLDVGDNQSQYTQPSIDSISEFRVLQSSFNAEYGRNEGMAVAVQTKSGSSSFHGTAYEYLRNNAFDAKCVLCNTLQPQLRYNQFGGNFSGWVPLPKISTRQEKKLFFFYNREMTRRNLPASAYADIPNSKILNGDFSDWLLTTNMQYAPQFKNGTIFQPGTIKRDGAGNIIDGVPFAGNIVPKSMMQQQSYNLLKPYLNVPGFASLPAAPNPGYVRYFYNNPNQLVKNQDLLRVDYAVSSRLNTFFRWVNDYQKETIQTGIWTGEPFPIQPQMRPKPGSSWSWNLVSTFTPSLASETILSYNHQSQSLSVVGDNPLDRNKLGADFPQLYPVANLTNSVPNVTASPISYSLGDPGWHNDGKDYAFTENVSWVKGPHTFKFGYYYNRDNKKQTATWPMNPNITFNSVAAMPMDTGNGLANLMLGNFNTYSQNNAHVYPYFRFLAHEAYAQDSWKVSRRLTVEFGLRFEHIIPTFTYTRGGTPGGEGTWTLYSVDLTKYNSANRPVIDLNTGKIVGDPMKALSPLGLVCDPCSGTPRGFSPAKNMFAPRLGLAYDLFGNGKTALRAGFGIFHERLRQNNFYFGAGGNWPNLTSASVLYGNTSNIDLSVTAGPAPPITPPGLPVWPSDNTVPSIYSWYTGIQHQLPAKFTLDVSYSGNHAIHLMDQRRINAVAANTFVVNPGLRASVNFKDDALRPYYGWGSLNAIETLSYSRYNAMMLRLNRRFANSLSFNFNYTLARTMDLVDNDSDQIINPFNLRQNWGPAGYDQTNVVTADFVYELPKVTGSMANAFTKTVLNGWEVTGMIRSQSGMPFSVGSNGSLMGVDAGSQYADLVGDPYAGQSKYGWLNPAAFQRPLDGQYGNTTRNQFRMPGIRNVDASLLKNFAIREGMRVTFRAEIFNLFNNAQIWSIVTGFQGDNPGSGISKNLKNFGVPTNYREARIIQLALRFAF